MGRSLSWLVVLAALTWHLWWVVAPPDPGGGPVQRTLGRDFATYYYAAVVARSGGDPYRTESLSAAARLDGTRDQVHPWFYPPPALFVVWWAPSLDLRTAMEVWRWLQELCLLVAALILAWWWRPLGAWVPAAVAGWIALCWGIPYGAAMGQINPLVLALVLGGLALAERDRPGLGGALVGIAAMIKMSPALFVLWWAARGSWRAVGAAALAAGITCLLSLLLAGPGVQLRFWTEVLPAFGSGDYNGLIIQISMFANHSLPNLFDAAFPGDGRTLGPAARALSLGSALVLAGAVVWLGRTRPTDPLIVAGHASAVAVATLLIPVYTYEHHLILSIPAAVLLSLAAIERRVAPGWWVVIAIAAIALAWPHPSLRIACEAIGGPAGAALRELKTAALVTLFAGCAAGFRT